ncbi:iron-siderophore ABC transporter substrate-binding protein [Ochrobactrum sp. CM-21-5]|nr:iron-siderophore ABC transporter substrate-binding protein [Ochrobactrum sp. CM-21-5]MBC2886335.1 iron-siderophore ABC transporter substrate-binding protein [Ochrobactrum sp. CM-21-5]
MAGLTRRYFLSGLPLVVGASFLGLSKAAAQKTQPRIVALEWRYADHARSLGIMPAGIADLEEYKKQASLEAAGAALAATIDMGRRQEPSLEAIIQAKPDIILGVHFRHDRIKERLSQIAETVLYKYTNTGTEDTDQLKLMLDELDDMGSRLNRLKEAQAAQVDFAQFLSRQKQALTAKQKQRPFVFAQFPSGVNSIRLFTGQSLPVRILEEMGLRNGWNGPSEGFGFSTVGPEKLLTVGDVTFIGVAIGTDNSYTRLSHNPLWQSFPFVPSGNLHIFDHIVWPFGGIPAAQAFGKHITEAL